MLCPGWLCHACKTGRPRVVGPPKHAQGIMRLRVLESMRTHPETVFDASVLASCYILLASCCPVNITPLLLRLSGVLLQASISWWTGCV